MSEVYVRRLRAVRDEFEAARIALLYVAKYWQPHDIQNEPEVAVLKFTLRPFEQAQQNVEQTYFVRLYAEFEGILKDHLATNHPSLPVPDRPKVDQLISLVLRAEAVRLDPILRAKMDAVRDYRNSIAHSKRRSGIAVISFVDALSRLNTVLAKLSDPRT